MREEERKERIQRTYETYETLKKMSIKTRMKAILLNVHLIQKTCEMTIEELSILEAEEKAKSP